MSFKKMKTFLANLAVFSILLFGLHAYLIHQFFDGILKIPIWAIYLFNAGMVFLVYFTLLRQVEKGQTKVLYYFIALTLGKMILAILFLSPLFLLENNDIELEVINFFAPYFLYLAFEIVHIYNFLQNI